MLVASCVAHVPACRSAARPLTLASISPPALPESQSASQANSHVNHQAPQQPTSTEIAHAEPQSQVETSLVSAIEVLPIAAEAVLPAMDTASLPVPDVPQAVGEAERLVSTSQDLVPQVASSLVEPVAVSKTEVAIAGVRAGRGIVHVAYFTDSHGFPDAKFAVRTESLASERESLTAEVREAGKVAIAVYQDINGDGTLNVNRFGIPVEPFAFSNNAMGKRGPPAFDEAAINIDSGAESQSKTIRIQLP